MLMKSINYIREKWDKHGLVTLTILSIIFLCIYALLRMGKQGTYNEYSSTPLWVSYSRSSYQPTQKRESTGETICRAYLERRFGRSFNKIRPDFLKNPVMGGYNLELDCFNRDIRLAVEYNGAQHYKYTPYFHRNKEAFANQKYRDEMKRTKCKENGIFLIEVPYTVSHEKIPNYLETELLKFGF
jgi:hypothetical protein